jgi:hypothetical protein
MTVLRALAVVLVANALFLAATWSTPLEPDVVADRVRIAFATAALLEEDFLPFDPRRGYFQYIDCFVLQMLVNEHPSRLARALAPIMYSPDTSGAGQCATLRALVVERADRAAFVADPYSRYWHGQNVPVAWGLRFMEVDTLRRVFVAVVWVAIAGLAAVSLRAGPHVRLAGLAIALTAALVWATPYFAPGFSYGPLDAVLLLGLVLLAARPKLARSADAIACFAAAYGACVVFLEMMSGELVVAPVWLGALALAAARDRHAAGLATSAPPVVAVVAVAAFIGGVAITVAVKQALVLGLLDASGVRSFVSHLGYYTSLPEAAQVPAVLVPFVEIAKNVPVLTYDSRGLAVLLIAGVGLAWSGAVARGWRRRHDATGRDVVLLAAMATAPAIWILMWTTHTVLHASFMVRMLAATIAVAPTALLWPEASHPESGD